MARKKKEVETASNDPGFVVVEITTWFSHGKGQSAKVLLQYDPQTENKNMVMKRRADNIADEYSGWSEHFRRVDVTEIEDRKQIEEVLTKEIQTCKEDINQLTVYQEKLARYLFGMPNA